MFKHIRICRWLLAVALCIPFVISAGTPVKSMVIFGDSLSDNGNTTHLLKSLRQEESPAYLVAPLRIFVINKMIEFADDYMVPQMVLDAGVTIVTDFFNNELAPYLANIIGRIRLVPIIPGKPYWQDRFSNGRVWNEYLAQMWSIPMDDTDRYTNKAFGGSWAATYAHQLTVWNLIRHPIASIKTLIIGKLIPPSLGITIQAYLMENQRIDTQSVYFVSSGANDYLNILVFEDNYDTETMRTYVDNVLDGFVSAVRKLGTAGAKRFVILGIPHIGNAPRYVNTGDKEVLNNAVDYHNERLQARIEELKLQFPETNFLFVDTDQALSKALTSPATYGFTNVNEACIDVQLSMFGALNNSPFAKNYVLRYAQALVHKDPSIGATGKNYSICNAPNEFLFWDDVHPSTRAHAYLAFEICNAMQDHGYDVKCRLPEEVL